MAGSLCTLCAGSHAMPASCHRRIMSAARVHWCTARSSTYGLKEGCRRGGGRLWCTAVGHTAASIACWLLPGKQNGKKLHLPVLKCLGCAHPIVTRNFVQIVLQDVGGPRRRFGSHPLAASRNRHLPCRPAVLSHRLAAHAVPFAGGRQLQLPLPAVT